MSVSRTRSPRAKPLDKRERLVCSTLFAGKGVYNVGNDAIGNDATNDMQLISTFCMDLTVSKSW